MSPTASPGSLRPGRAGGPQSLHLSLPAPRGSPAPAGILPGVRRAAGSVGIEQRRLVTTCQEGPRSQGHGCPTPRPVGAHVRGHPLPHPRAGQGRLPAGPPTHVQAEPLGWAGLQPQARWTRPVCLPRPPARSPRHPPPSLRASLTFGGAAGHEQAGGPVREPLGRHGLHRSRRGLRVRGPSLRAHLAGEALVTCRRGLGAGPGAALGACAVLPPRPRPAPPGPASFPAAPEAPRGAPSLAAGPGGSPEGRTPARPGFSLFPRAFSGNGHCPPARERQNRERRRLPRPRSLPVDRALNSRSPRAGQPWVRG